MPQPAAPALTHEIVTARTIVRSYRSEDAEALYTTVAASREHLKRWLPWPDQHSSVDASRAIIDLLRDQWRQSLSDPSGVPVRETGFSYGIFAREDGALLGGLGLHPRNWSVPYFEIGYWLSASAEGHGYMTEATAALVEYAFHDLGARRLEIRCDARNTRSADVARRLGFAQDGLLRQDAIATDGALRDTLVFSRIA